MRSPLTLHWFATVPPDDEVLAWVAARLGKPIHRLVVQDHRGQATATSRIHRLAELHAANLVVVLDDLETQPRITLRRIMALATLSDRTYLADLQGRWIRVSRREVLARGLPELARSQAEATLTLRLLRGRVDRLLATPRRRNPAPSPRTGRVAYLRTDMRFGLRAGGSVGHIAGVIDGLRRAGHAVHVFSSAPLPLDPRRCERLEVLSPPRAFHEIPDALALRYGAWLGDRLRPSLHRVNPAFLYQRYSVGNGTGVSLSRHLGIPLILEYNGSEIWASRNWERPLRHERLASDIEDLNLRHAHLISVVSRTLEDELVDRGVEPERIVFHPNGIEPERFDPEELSRSADRLRDDLGLPHDGIVAGFIGTFSLWHGVEVLAEAIPMMLRRDPDLRFLLIGAGPLSPMLRSRLQDPIGRGQVVMTGIVDQADAPAYLMACDICLSPHVENPDGSPFFGSPTKLFEYMALAKGIVASDLGQIAEVLAHGETAVLTPPGDAAAFAEAVLGLVRDASRRARLGEAARRDVLARYTWEHNVEALRRAMGRLGLLRSR